jgi:hypothetical protein
MGAASPYRAVSLHVPATWHEINIDGGSMTQPRRLVCVPRDSQVPPAPPVLTLPYYPHECGRLR